MSDDQRSAIAREAKQELRGAPMLAQIYNWFAEGFDTADLKDAKAYSTACPFRALWFLKT